MPKQNTFIDSIEITQEAFNKIMSWANALEEVVYLTAVKDNRICDAFRLLNTSRETRNYFDYSLKEEKMLRKHILKLVYEKIILCNSHPGRNHVRTVSITDWKYLPNGTIQIIAFPLENNLGAWILKDTYIETLKSKVRIEIK
jgi:hypothetical protein